MDYLVISVTAAAVSVVTLFSGFGLGTVLMPAFALFFPVPVAVAATAVVHFANNLFKAVLLGKKADYWIVLRFGLPAAAAAIAGASLLTAVAPAAPLFAYQLAGERHDVTPVKLVVGLLIAGFAIFEFRPAPRSKAFGRRYVALGGALSGFFGGLSGNQGPLRAAFLINAGLDKDAYVATSALAAVIVDLSRLIVYGLNFSIIHFHGPRGDIKGLVLAATAAAFAGSFAGSRLVRSITLRAVQVVVAVMLVLVGLAMATGLI